MGQTAGWATFQGEHRNLAGYAYAASVPPGLTGYRAPAPAPDHGFAIDLASDFDAHIWVDGSYNVAFARSARAVAEGRLGWIREKGKIIGRPRFHNSELGGLHGVELAVQYFDNATGTTRSFTSITALRGRADPDDPVGIVYEISLDTSSDRIAKDKIVWRSVLRSFTLLPQ